MERYLESLLTGPCRQEVPLADGEVYVWHGFGSPPRSGYRWETDAEFRARLTACIPAAVAVIHARGDDKVTP